MADRGRDLKFSILSDLDKFDTDKPARGLEDLGDSADKAGTLLDRFEDTAREVARRVGDAFDDISRGSRKTFTKDLDDDLDKGKRGLDDFKDEARSSGREAAASFGGGFDDVGDFIQETAANAFEGFGPLGALAGTTAAIGIGIATKAIQDAKDRAAEAKEQIKDFFDAFVEGQGRITEQSIQGRLSDLLGDPDEFAKIREEAGRAGVAVELYARALAGDPEAVERLQKQMQQAADVVDDRYARAFANAVDVTTQLGTEQRGILDPTKNLSDLTAQAASAQGAQSAALEKVGGKLKDVKDRLGDATSAYNVLKDATAAGITIGIDIPSPRELDAINRRVRDGIGTIVVPVAAGQSRYENNANNSRYRW